MEAVVLHTSRDQRNRRLLLFTTPDSEATWECLKFLNLVYLDVMSYSSWAWPDDKGHGAEFVPYRAEV